MSWMKRGQAGAGPGAQPYGAAPPQAQPFGNQQNMYPNYQGGTMPAQGQQAQQFWQPPAPSQPAPQQYNHTQAYTQPYAPDYSSNANQFQAPQQTQYNQNYTNQFPNPQQNYQQNYYPNHTQPNYSQNVANTGTGKADGWEDNWDWGWDENAKKVQNLQGTGQQPPAQQQVFNNANVIEESFAGTDSWNWTMDDKKENKAPAVASPNQVSNEPALPQTQLTGNSVLSEAPLHNINNQQTEEVKTLSDRDAIKDKLPNLALGKRFHLENLTPQWSIESQMSQESSDGPHTLSEGTYRSDNQSRNSGESPGPGMDNSNYNYAQAGFDETYTQNSEWSKGSDEATIADPIKNMSRRESHEELSNSLHEMSINNDHHNVNNIHQEHNNFQENMGSQPPSLVSPQNLAAPVSEGASSPSPSMPPLGPGGAASAHPRPASSASTSSLTSHSSAAPPTNVPHSSVNPVPISLSSLPPPPNSQNPFQRAGPFSHKSTNKSSGVPATFQPPMPPNLASPAAVSKMSQNRGTVGFEANLETTPDNSERPDQPQVPFRPPPAPQPVPDNLEVAPQNDRNEYLQTAHLSTGDYGENTDFTRSLPPPPGLRRMVLGQQEPEYRNLNVSGDEPPPGLSRMVPGQQTEADDAYNQPADNYLDRHIDGQLMDDASTRPFRRADGHQNADAYSQQAPGRGNDRRPLGFDRMVPGEPSNDEYSQYQSSNYASNEHRVVTGVDRDFPMPTDHSGVREQNVDGSDFSEAPRNVAGSREAVGELTQDFTAPDESQREVIMEGENLQDLSVVSSADLTFSREHLDGADLTATDAGTDRNDASDSLERPAAAGSRRHSLNRTNTSGDDSERDRAFKASPRRDRSKRSRDADRERNRDPDRVRDRNRDRDKDGRYARGDRGDRKYDREDRRRDDKRSDKERRDRDREREAAPDSPGARAQRRSTRSRKYDDDDTDYYSDKERERRRYREGSYTSKPPRPEDRDRRYNTVERERRRDRPRDAPRDPPRRDRDRYERYHADYRDIDPSRKYGNLHRERENERRRVTFSTDAKSNDSRSEGETFSTASRPSSREAAGATDEEAPRRSEPRTRRRHHRQDPYYDGYGGGYADPYMLQRQQYEYYEQLRVTDPAAYMQIYKQLMAGHAPPAPIPPQLGYSSLGYEGQERGSVHSGRSSTTGLKGNDTFSVYCAGAASLRAPSVRTDLSDRDLNTDASLGLQLDASTVRSERMTPFHFSTAHIRASLAVRDIVVVPAAYPVDGAPATVQVLSLSAACAADPLAAELTQAPGPLVKGVTHKKSVIEYCMVRVRRAAAEGARDPLGYVLLWELLALMLRQNGVVVGSDIAELLMKNTREYPAGGAGVGAGGRRGSDSRDASPDRDLSDNTGLESPGSGAADERAALDKFREYLLYGNRQEALEWAMSNNLWGHALQLAWGEGRRARGAVAARFLASIPRTDPLHTLYAALANTPPPAATGVSEERWGEWRTHAAVLLANSTPRPEQDQRTMLTLGDSLQSRGLWYSAQFCYVCGDAGWARHPLAPLAPPAPPAPAPRLTLLLAAPRAASLAALATPRAVLATEIYEYARSLNGDYVMHELQVYKLVQACRLVDCGQYARALAYVEAAARAVTQHAALHSRALVAALAELADRLQYHEPALLEAEGAGADSAEGSPRHAHAHAQWLHDVKLLAHNMQMESASQQSTPQHEAHVQPPPQEQVDQNTIYGWADQTQQQYQQPVPTYAAPEPSPYAQYYAPPAPAPPAPEEPDAPAPPPAESTHHEDWQQEEPAQAYEPAPYWPQDTSYYGEQSAARPTISMPGASGPQRYAADDDRPPSAEHDEDSTSSKEKGDARERREEKGERGEGKKGGSWIGGLFNKLSLRAPNQMILPDDKNPTIVWDAAAQRWRNTDGTEDAAGAPPPPPPRAADLPHAMPSASPPLSGAAPPGPGAPGPPVSNIFKMQKTRHIKKSYVDVFNPSGAAERPRPAPGALLAAPPPPLAAAPAFFVPPASPPAVLVLIPPPPLPSPPRSPRSSASEGYEQSDTDLGDRSAL